MAVNSVDKFVAGGQYPMVGHKNAFTHKGNGFWGSYWTVTGFPGAGATPPAFNTSGYVPDRNTAGAHPIMNPVSGESRLSRVLVSSTSAQTVRIVSRLWACSGFDSNSASLQTITNQTNAGRQTDYTGIELGWECYGDTGATAGTWTVLYTNQAGVSGRSATFAKPASTVISKQFGFFDLQAGDTGVQSVQSFQSSIGSGTSGNIGLTLIRTYDQLDVAGNFKADEAKAPLGGMVPIPNDECFFWLGYCAGNALPTLLLSYVQG